MNKKRPKLLTALSLIVSIGLSAQSDFIATGSTQTSAAGSASISIGQVTYTSATSSSGSMSNGVQQAYVIDVEDGIEQKHINLNLTAYPNPTTENVWLSIEEGLEGSFSYAITDNMGKLISRSIIEDNETQIQMSHLASGSYYIMVTQNQESIKTFKILKSN